MKTIVLIARDTKSVFSNTSQAIGLACVIVVLLLTACRELPVYAARRKVPIGMPRDEAVQILKEGAWYYQPCDKYGATDLFFYGSHHVDDTDIVIVDSSPYEGTYRVHSVGAFENYLWPKVYDYCLDMERFEK